jgi:hypothetical protein
MTYGFTLARRVVRIRAALFASLFVFAAGCESDRLTPAESPDDVGAEGTDVLQIEEPAFSISANRRGTAFGLWRLEFTQLSDQWTSLKKTASPSSIRSDLEKARSRGARVFIQIAGHPKYYRTSSGKFDLSKFKERLNKFKGVNIGTYINDGTFAGHMMIDEPSDPSNWGGRPIPYDQLEAAARYSKSLWPNLPTLLRTRPTWLAKASFSWRYLDGGWAQYASRFGSVTNYRDAEVRAAKNKGLKVVFGLNILDGGNGSSGIRGTKSGHYSMSGSELLKYGKPLLSASASCGFLMWRYSSDYLSRSSIRSAMKELRSVAGNTATTNCRS